MNYRGRLFFDTSNPSSLWIFFGRKKTSLIKKRPSELQNAPTNITSATDAPREHVQFEQCSYMSYDLYVALAGSMLLGPCVSFFVGFLLETGSFKISRRGACPGHTRSIYHFFNVSVSLLGFFLLR